MFDFITIDLAYEFSGKRQKSMKFLRSLRSNYTVKMIV